MGKGGFQTETHRRMMRGESIPAWRPPGLDGPSRRAVPEGLPPDAAAHMLTIAPRVLPVPPGSQISAADARAAALLVREWLEHDGAEIDNRELLTVARWVIHQTKPPT